MAEPADMHNPRSAVGAALSSIEVSDAPRADAIADALDRHLRQMTRAALPSDARPYWEHCAGKLLKARADAPLADRAIASVRSWPRPRLDELVADLRAMQAVLEQTDNDRMDDEFRTSIARTYL